jgi:nitroreductase
MEKINEEKNKILDEIILSRRSIREFKSDIPPKEDIEAIVAAGLQAPFAAIAVVGEKYFRRFFILKHGETSDKISKIIQKKIKVIADNLNQQIKENPAIKGENFAKILDEAANKFRIRSPYFIIVAEKQGFPHVGQLSLAHCLENMWLKASALGLGFQLISVVAEMSNDSEFCKIIGIEPGEYVLNGCAIGYAKSIPPAVERPSLNEITTWIE